MATNSPTAATWQIDPGGYPRDGSLDDRIRFLLGYAILAPSSHNTQPWKFRLRDNRVDVLLDFSRWLKVADDDQRELHISVGCALENLLIAAEHFGLGHESVLLPTADDPSIAATITFCEQGQSVSLRPSDLFEMIPARHTNHQRYEDRAIPEHILQQLPQHPFRMGYAPAEKQHTPRRPIEEVLV